VSWSEIHIYRLVDGKIAEHWVELSTPELVLGSRVEEMVDPAHVVAILEDPGEVANRLGVALLGHASLDSATPKAVTGIGGGHGCVARAAGVIAFEQSSRGVVVRRALRASRCMGHSPLQIVEQFLHMTNDRKDIAGAAALMGEAIHFVGPAQQCEGRDAYVKLLEMFLPSHVSWRIHARFENTTDACVIGDIVVRDPRGAEITLELAEWYRVADGKIAEHRVFYDPREFMKAFGMA
jgi:predicted SnoaL-like aldol condensation-catalyzing enzyme